MASKATRPVTYPVPIAVCECKGTVRYEPPGPSDACMVCGRSWRRGGPPISEKSGPPQEENPEG